MLKKPLKRLTRHRAFAALRYRNYRLWFWGQLISIFGTWMQMTAQGYFIYQLTHSETYLGLTAFLAGIPIWLFMFYAGVLSDRIPRRTLLLVTQTSMMLLAFILAALTFLNIVQPWHILLLSFLLGIANAFDAPTRHAFILDMVKRTHLTNAVSLNGTMFNFGMVAGPAIGGLTYALFGPAWCFLLNGISYVAIIVALALMRFEPFIPKPPLESFSAELREGIAHIRSDPTIKAIFLQITVMNLFAMAFLTLIPAWAVSVLHGDATTNGLLQSARGAGALFVALYLASVRSISGRARLIIIAAIITPLLVIAFALASWLYVSLAILALIGATTLIANNISSVEIQSRTSDRLRGRVMSFYTFIYFGIMPLSALWIGPAAEHFGIQNAIYISASISVAAAVVMWWLFRRTPINSRTSKTGKNTSR